MKLGINVDHVATVRQARGGIEPDPCAGALEAQRGGADGITIHLREDRRHIQDKDVRRMKRLIRVPLNLEMALHAEIVRMALRIAPEKICLVPEKRRELTTEGGLDVCAKEKQLRKVIPGFRVKGIEVSLFIDPSRRQIEAAHRVGADAIEIHTGAYANAKGDRKKRELQRIRDAARYADRLKLKTHAGHGLDYRNVRPICAIPEIRELNIGHSIVSYAVFVGMRQAVRKMKKTIATPSTVSTVPLPKVPGSQFGTPSKSARFNSFHSLNLGLLEGVPSRWKRRNRAAHKGEFGRVFIVAGSKGLTGAAHLASVGALRAGAGLVTLGVPESVWDVLARRSAEVMVRSFSATRAGGFALRAAKNMLAFAKGQQVLALGPGLSQQPETQKFIRRLIMKSAIPVVLDADGLNAVCGHLSCLQRISGRSILTPHPGEFKRLFGEPLSADENERRKRACMAAKKYGTVIVLKGHRTVVASPSGRVYVNVTGNPGMASGGTGDVLTGIIAALVAQKFSLWDAAKMGVYLHGAAGDLGAKQTGQVSLTAGDILKFLPEAIRKLR